MNKIFLITGLIIIFSIGAFVLFTMPTGLKLPALTKHVYIKYSDNKKSNVFIECKNNSDCKLAKLMNGGFVPVNSANKDVDIEEYAEWRAELIKNMDFYAPPLRIEDYRPICKNNECDYISK